MGNLYRLNSLYELELKSYPNLNSFSNAALKRAEIFEYLFLFLSKPSDHVLFNSEANTVLLDYWKSQGFTFGSAYVYKDHHSARIININPILQIDKLIEWGNTFQLEKDSLKKNNLIIKENKFLNSKIQQTRWKIENTNTPYSIFLCTDFDAILECIPKVQFPIVLKSEFSFSGSGNLLISNNEDLYKNKNRIDNLFKDNLQGLILEEWKKEFIQYDFSSLYQVKNNTCNYLASTRMLIDEKGQFCGSELLSEQNDFSEMQTNILGDFLKDQKITYSGCLSIDGFSFLENGITRFQYFSEINFRWSMGRILFEIQKKLNHENKKSSMLFLDEKSLLSFLDDDKNSQANMIYLSPELKTNGIRIVYLAE